MSGFTQTTDELLYAFYGAATTSTPTTSPGSSITAGYPPVVVPAGFMRSTGSQSSSLRLEIGGLATATATIPTWQFFLYTAVQTTSAPAFAATNTLGSTAAFTPGTAEANDVWTATIHIGLRALALGAASTVVAVGEFKSDVFVSAAFAVQTQLFVSMPGPGAYTPLATWDTTQGYVLWPALSLGAGTAGNTVTTQYCKLYGEN